MTFKNRTEAGRLLAKALKQYQGKEVVVYGLPRGGVVVAAKIAKKLKSPLDLIIVRKIGHPQNPEYALGAVSEDGQTVFNEAEKVLVDPDWLKQTTEKEQTEAKRRHKAYLGNRPPISVTGKTAIIIDDGVATGLTMEAAIKEVKQQDPQKVIMAVPVIPKDTYEHLKREVDEVVVLDIPEEFAGAVGAYYRDFPQVSDEEVIKLLK